MAFSRASKMANGISPYIVRYDEAGDYDTTFDLETIMQENDALRKQNAELRREIAELERELALLRGALTPRPTVHQTSCGWTPSITPEKPFMRPTKASKFREVTFRHDAENGVEETSKSTRPAATKRNARQWRPRPPSRCNGNAALKAPEPRYMQPTTASVRKKDARRTSIATKAAPTLARSLLERTPSLHQSRRPNGAKPAQTQTQTQPRLSSLAPYRTVYTTRRPAAANGTTPAPPPGRNPRGRTPPPGRTPRGRTPPPPGTPSRRRHQANGEDGSLLPACPSLSYGSSIAEDSFPSTPVGSIDWCPF
ncbi:hypothetical protein N658DRAFT_201601 [Parathielavia hyrcaniae]|uniref:Uncharacterized protein n=1 Tax=Parathielavia hyrcaniae TaxID=113614 RepID=A0AAN6QCS4_9PEZI|nr:hypothetical protein N658DRAFT_201601 [Parathielavia hyrcaniae]